MLRAAIPCLLVSAGCTEPVAVVHLAMSVHVEGFGEDEGTAEQQTKKYEQHVARLDELQAVLDPHRVVLSFEPEMAYLIGESAYLASTGISGELTSLAERAEAGHAVAPHGELFSWSASCPPVYTSDGTGVGAYTDPAQQCPGGIEGLTGLRAAFEAVGLPAPVALSGACASGDWLAMVQTAGFSTVSGVVGTCARTIPAESLATYEGDYSRIHTDACEKPKDCHEQMPLGEAGKLQAWRASDPLNWLSPTPAGTLTIVPSVGDPRCMEEYAAEDAPETPCTYSQGDLDAYFGRLDDAVAAATDGQDRILVLTLSVGTDLSDTDLELLEDWAARADRDYVAVGLAAWSSVEQAAATAD